jgi:hypothetical protein
MMNFNLRHFGRQLTSGPVLAVLAVGVTHTVTAVYQAGYRHILSDGPTAVTIASEVPANLRAFMLLVLFSWLFFLIFFVTSRLGLLFRWRTTALALTAASLMLEITTPFFDLYQYLTVCIGIGTIGVMLLEGALQYLDRICPAAETWLRRRGQLFDEKFKEAAVKRIRELHPVGGRLGSHVLDALLVVFCLLVLAYWCGEAHAMKHLHLWGN